MWRRWLREAYGICARLRRTLAGNWEYDAVHLRRLTYLCKSPALYARQALPYRINHQSSTKSIAFLAGGETIVHLTGNGEGGRNQELALSAAEGIAGLEDFYEKIKLFLFFHLSLYKNNTLKTQYCQQHVT